MTTHTPSHATRAPPPGAARRKPRAGRALLQALGPGILMCGAAVGVSHLVQATRAGAEYGLLLLGLVVLACVLKYPFLEFGPRYAAATGEHMIRGYRRMGRWAHITFALITVATFWIIQAGVTVATAGLAGMVFGLDWSLSALSAGVLGACMLLLAFGRFRALDLTMKLIVSALALSTVSAAMLAWNGWPADTPLPWGPSPGILWSATGFAFVLALLGWMPIPLDVAAWHSLWTLESARQTSVLPSVRHAVIDFQIGYGAATLLAVVFLGLGALVLYGGSGFSDSAVVFSGQLIDMYTRTLGEWSRPLIGVAALTAMFSTTLAVTDAYPRVIIELVRVARSPSLTRSVPATLRPHARDTHMVAPLWYAAVLVVVGSGALLIIHWFSARFTQLIDFATTVSFMTAPVLAWMNLKLVTGPHMPLQHRPGTWLRSLAWAGIVFLVAFCLIWLGWRIY